MTLGIFILIAISLFKALLILGLFLLIFKRSKIKLTEANKVLIIILAFIFFILTNSEQYFAPYPFIETKFAEGFSLNNYRKISHGMTRSSVESLIGKGIPNHYSMLPDATNDEKACVLYSEERNLIIFDFAWIGMNVCYNNNYLVTRTFDSVIHN